VPAGPAAGGTSAARRFMARSGSGAGATPEPG